MEKRARMWLKTFLIIAGLLFFCFIVGRRESGTDYEKEARIRQYEADESVEKLQTVLLAYGEALQAAEDMQLAEEGRTPDGGQAAADGQAENQRQPDKILTTDGVYTYQMDGVEELLYKQVTAYVKDGCILEAEKENRQEETLLSNVWIIETEEGRILCFSSENAFYLPYQAQEDDREQVADVVLLDGEIKECRFKKEKISGKLLGVTEEAVILEEGQIASEESAALEEGQTASEENAALVEKRYVLDENVRVYRLYGTLEEMSLAELQIGYDNTDYVLDGEEVCACLVTSEEAMETIRVLLQSGNYGGRFHESVTLSADCDYTLRYGEEKREFAAGEPVSITPDSEYFDNQDRIVMTTSVNTGKITLESIQRKRERADYRGSMEILRTDEGLAVINELLLEEYLYGVVPSEMPASYPQESLKAQAVCARTYAYRNMEKAGFPELGAHVDDSTAYQVYGNTEERAETTAAVKATKGRLLMYEGEPIDAYYYSTSCGYGTDIRAWNGSEADTVPYLTAKSILTEAVNADTSETGASAGFPSPEELTDEEAFQELIEESPAGFLESDEAWFRWRYAVDETDIGEMERRLRERYAAQPQFILTENGNDYISQQPGRIGNLKELAVIRRNTGGNAAELLLTGSLGAYLVRTEYNIRYVLLNGNYPVVRRDGEEIAVSAVLPSAFLTVKTGKENGNVVGYSVAGGGYGHGIGMSQNGAKNMALAGLTAEEILDFFYEGCRLETVY